MSTNTATIRELQSGDVDALYQILHDDGVFTDEEIATALELMEIFLSDPNQGDYYIYTAVTGGGEVAGYVCVGPTALTHGTFDLYWIAVKPSLQNRGIGKQLSQFAERKVMSSGGRLLIAETSGQPKYGNTRAFYLSHGYRELARIKGYYKIDDDLVIYGKYLSQ